MRFRLPICAVAALFAVLTVGPSLAQPQLQPPGGGGGGDNQPAPSGGLVTRADPEETAKAMQQAGYTQTETGKWNSGVAYARGTLNNIRVNADHQECKESGCRLVVFWVDFGVQSTIDLEYMNAWNRDYRFARLYRDSRNHVLFTWHVPIYSGVAPTYMRVAASQFASLLKDVLQYTPKKQ